MLIPIYDQHQTEPLAWHRAIEGVIPRDAQQFFLSDGNGHEGSVLSSHQGSRQHGPLLQNPSQGSTTICSWRQGLAQWVEYHHSSSNEEIGPQVAWFIPSGQGHILECILTQTTVII